MEPRDREQALQHGRLPWLRPGHLTPQARAVYDRIVGGPRSSGPRPYRLRGHEGRLEGPFNAMLVAPKVGGPLQELGAAIRYHSTLDDRHREIAILAVAAERRAEYVWYAHSQVASGIGLTDAEIDAISRGTCPDMFDGVDRAVHRTACRLVLDRGLDDDTFSDVESVLGRERLIELTILVGYYDLLDLVMRVVQTPLPRGVSRRWPDPPGPADDPPVSAT